LPSLIEIFMISGKFTKELMMSDCTLHLSNLYNYLAFGPWTLLSKPHTMLAKTVSDPLRWKKWTFMSVWTAKDLSILSWLILYAELLPILLEVAILMLLEIMHKIYWEWKHRNFMHFRRTNKTIIYNYSNIIIWWFGLRVKRKEISEKIIVFGGFKRPILRLVYDRFENKCKFIDWNKSNSGEILIFII
jgi:hypothetical protein